MDDSNSLEETIRRTIEIIEALGLNYAVGGAVAMGLGGFQRHTNDMDLLIALPALRYQELADALNRAGFTQRDEQDNEGAVEVPRARREALELGRFVVWHGEFRVEFFVPKVPLQDAILKRHIRVDLDEFSLWTTTAEDMILLKMIFRRPKDIEDVRRLMVVRRDDLDVPYIESWIDRTLEAEAAAELRRMISEAGFPGRAGDSEGPP